MYTSTSDMFAGVITSVQRPYTYPTNDYGSACEVLLDGLKLDPGNTQIENALWEDRSLVPSREEQSASQDGGRASMRRAFFLSSKIALAGR
ncbi:hypothetical protein E2562_020642 [Oryza meyeriana var. granulata]|uniref:Uncharacterized protein n=1 Tax=Oryza meyeriana var. granulata TaxID=110450 RepID=A0A6G1EA12_9ORYZ|nr:hypothetical protein E2562_020642 [Oryza meyeriana var. granulata]